nr:hypothetical protein [Tanacetum cinerariifolium]
MPDDGMEHASSGVADECTYSSRAESSSICRSLGINKRDGLNLVSEVVQAVYSADATVFEELGAVEPCGGTCDDPEFPEEPKVLDGPACGGGGGS